MHAIYASLSITAEQRQLAIAEARFKWQRSQPPRPPKRLDIRESDEAIFELVDQPFEIAIVLRNGHFPYKSHAKLRRPLTPPTKPKLAFDDDSITSAGSSSSSDEGDVDDCELFFEDGDSTMLWDYPGLGLSIEICPMGSGVLDADACEERTRMTQGA